MAGHLGPGFGEVEDAAQAVLGFWFDELGPEQRFAKDDAVDRICAERFGALREEVLAHQALGWRSEPEHLLAAVILLDQFSRNIHRGSAEAFAADPLAESLAREGLERGWLGEFPPERAHFLLMPLMHAEHADAQAASVAGFEQLGLAEPLAFAREHQEVFQRFGRFPGRNAALGRETTAEEREYLSQPGAGW